MKKLMMLAITLLSVSAFAEIKIAYIDVQKVIEGTADGKKAKATFSEEGTKKQKEFAQKEENIKKMGEDIQKKKGVLSEEALQKKQADFQEEFMKFREAQYKAQTDMQKRERELMAPILDKMKKVIEKVSNDMQLTLVVDKNQGVIWAKSDIDITDAIVKEYEKTK